MIRECPSVSGSSSAGAAKRAYPDLPEAEAESTNEGKGLELIPEVSRRAKQVIPGTDYSFFSPANVRWHQREPTVVREDWVGPGDSPVDVDWFLPLAEVCEDRLELTTRWRVDPMPLSPSRTGELFNMRADLLVRARHDRVEKETTSLQIGTPNGFRLSDFALLASLSD
ncbi:hypothetical protein SUGI_1493970 [Cryptomeria japonica]|uniref:Uncharacterized protein n=1 Tax=Cryptomeria japonica TaxID=3369 RepID=A0AAD3RRN5_CRYJA|nr:hypothetical protein SUGI_1493970 [Cryptomeria japonica]